jgi:hypothetical protein
MRYGLNYRLRKSVRQNSLSKPFPVTFLSLLMSAPLSLRPTPLAVGMSGLALGSTNSARSNLALDDNSRFQLLGVIIRDNVRFHGLIGRTLLFRSLVL